MIRLFAHQSFVQFLQLLQLSWRYTGKGGISYVYMVVHLLPPSSICLQLSVETEWGQR